MYYFAYVSRGKIAQLYDQISDLSNISEKRQVRRSIEGRGRFSAGWKAILGGEIEGSGGREVTSEITGNKSDIQKLRDLLIYINENEDVADLNSLCEQGPGAQLNAFAYTYIGSFRALGSLGRTPPRRDGYYGRGGIEINEAVLRDGPEEIVISKDSLVSPAREENDYKEIGPNDGALVSDIAILVSQCGDYTINLACSYKYFGDMGGHWNEANKEWSVSPHSGNGRFFYEGMPEDFEAMLFVNGVRAKTIFGSPLFLSHTAQGNLQL